MRNGFLAVCTSSGTNKVVVSKRSNSERRCNVSVRLKKLAKYSDQIISFIPSLSMKIIMRNVPIEKSVSAFQSTEIILST